MNYRCRVSFTLEIDIAKNFSLPNQGRVQYRDQQHTLRIINPRVSRPEKDLS